MREYFTYGSVRGAAGNGRPYRDPTCSLLLQLTDLDLTEFTRMAFRLQ